MDRWNLQRAAVNGAVFGALALIVNAIAHDGFAGTAAVAVGIQAIGGMLGGAVLFVFWALVFGAVSKRL